MKNLLLTAFSASILLFASCTKKETIVEQISTTKQESLRCKVRIVPGSRNEYDHGVVLCSGSSGICQIIVSPAYSIMNGNKEIITSAIEGELIEYHEYLNDNDFIVSHAKSISLESVSGGIQSIATY
jgi:hypothetical protein